MQSNPAVGREMLESLPLARSSLVVAALTQQWSGGASELARKIIECDCPPRQAASHLRQAASGFGLISKLLNPPEVVIAGPPNAGKSTLCNALIGRQVSIVDESAGTTRDWVRELALFGGVPVWLTDTAGLWQAPTPVDAEAIRRARRRAEGADLVVLIGAGEQVETPRWLHARRLLRVSAKCDACAPKGKADVIVSAHSGEGLDELKREILRSLGLLGVDVSKPMAFTARQADMLEQAARAIEANDPSAAREKLRALLAD
jgi:tRNA modification GTPase